MQPMKHCMACGAKLTEKYLEGEGMIPYCSACGQFRFPIFNTAVSMVVMDAAGEKILLIKQYNRPDYILVAGYVNRGESVEHAVRREILEETGMHVSKIQFNRSKFFEPSNTLMINFAAFAENPAELHSNREIDSWAWFSKEEALIHIKPNSLAREFLTAYLEGLKE